MSCPISRRSILAVPAAALADVNPEIRREIFVRSPSKGVAVMAYSFYTKRMGGDMISIEQRWSRSDTVDVAYYRPSQDHGRTWGVAAERPTGEWRPSGMLRRHPRGGWVDPVKGWFVEFWNEGVLPNDDPLEGLRQWKIHYTVSKEGGRTRGPAQQVIHKGSQYDDKHPLPGIWTGRNCAMLGDMTAVPLKMRDGSILLPVEVTLLNRDGSLYNPAGAYTYHDAAVLIGRWAGDVLEWEMSRPVKGDPEKSTRGMLEPTLAALPGGRVMMVLRGSNDKKPWLPSHKWVSFSKDGGRTWTRPEPWTYADGKPFYSPSACSQLLRHSSGRLFWLGNVTSKNPSGNRPRYPFVIGEVELERGLLIRESVRVVDDKGPRDDPVLTLSNFYAREDRRTREIALHMTRLFALVGGWMGDAHLYCIGV